MARKETMADPPIKEAVDVGVGEGVGDEGVGDVGVGDVGVGDVGVGDVGVGDVGVGEGEVSHIVAMQSLP
jgi:hypothetical protein